MKLTNKLPNCYSGHSPIMTTLSTHSLDLPSQRQPKPPQQHLHSKFHQHNRKLKENPSNENLSKKQNTNKKFTPRPSIASGKKKSITTRVEQDGSSPRRTATRLFIRHTAIPGNSDDTFYATNLRRRRHGVMARGWQPRC